MHHGKSRGEAFLQKLRGGKCINYQCTPPKFLQKTLREGIQHDGHNLMFHFLKSFWRSLLLEAKFLAWNSPNTVWRPGSARTRWGELNRSPDPLAAIRGPTSKGREKERKGRGGGGNLLQGVRGDRRPCSCHMAEYCHKLFEVSAFYPHTCAKTSMPLVSCIVNDGLVNAENAASVSSVHNSSLLFTRNI